MGELQPALAAALGKEYANDECGDRISAHSVSVVAAGDVAQLRGTVHYERWECLKADVPEFKGLEVTFETRIVAKTRLLEQSAEICIDLRPVIENEGRSLRLDAQVTCAKLSEHSILGMINSVVSLEGVFRDLAQDVVNKAGDKLELAVPEDLRGNDPRVTSAAFYDRGGGRLGLRAEGHATVTAAQLLQLIAEYGRR